MISTGESGDLPRSTMTCQRDNMHICSMRVIPGGRRISMKCDMENGWMPGKRRHSVALIFRGVDVLSHAPHMGERWPVFSQGVVD
jgi:hypothetical protein